MAQTERDLEVAQRDATGGYFEWVCFAAYQAAEKALKAVYQRLGGEARGRDLDGLLHGCASRIRILKALSAQMTELGKYYVTYGYPNTHVERPPLN